MGKTLSSEQKMKRFKFLVLRRYQLQMVADAKKKIKFNYICKIIT